MKGTPDDREWHVSARTNAPVLFHLELSVMHAALNRIRQLCVASGVRGVTFEFDESRRLKGPSGSPPLS